MINGSIARRKGSGIGLRAGKWVAMAALAGLVGLGLGLGAPAMAQAEPTLNQVYEAARSGKLDQAQVMMQQVLVAHPGSAKAHYVQAELFAKQGKTDKAREALASAEKIAPGLPFAKTDAVQNLRSQLNGNTPAASSNKGGSSSGGNFNRAVTTPAAAATASSFPWGVALALGGAAIGLGIYMSRNKATAAQGAPAYGLSPGQQGGGLGGQPGFGMGSGMPQAYGNQPPAYGQPGFGQPAQPGMGLGGRVAGGLAAGLAVGAGVMAAQAIGKSLMGGNEHTASDNSGSNYQPTADHNDLGGQNFGVADSSSWDDSSSLADSGGGGDWDS